MKKHPGHALALTASSLILLDAVLVAITFTTVLILTSFHEPRLGEMLSTTPLPFALYLTWALAVFGTNLLGDALRDVLDPRQRD